MSHDTRPEPTASFEDALKQIERIVADLEQGESDLSAALAKYEQAVRLLAHCHGLLDGAERTVALLTGVDDRGQPLTTPFDAAATAAREPAPDGKAPPKRPYTPIYPEANSSKPSR